MMGKHRCRAKKKDGGPCRSWASVDYVCYRHIVSERRRIQKLRAVQRYNVSQKGIEKIKAYRLRRNERARTRYHERIQGDALFKAIRRKYLRDWRRNKYHSNPSFRQNILNAMRNNYWNKKSGVTA